LSPNKSFYNLIQVCKRRASVFLSENKNTHTELDFSYLLLFGTIIIPYFSLFVNSINDFIFIIGDQSAPHRFGVARFGSNPSAGTPPARSA
jgi:hypothetical protein